MRMSSPRKPGGPRLVSDKPKTAPKAAKPRRDEFDASAQRRTTYHKESARDAQGRGRKSNGGGGGGGFRTWLRRWWNRSLAWRLVSLGFTLAAIGAIILMPFLLTLPDITQLGDKDHKPSIIVVSDRGDPIGQFGDVMGEAIPYKQLPPSLINALVSTEDRRFFEHMGVDPWGILRAMVVNARAGHVVQGGSTLTQQLAKNVFLSPDRTMLRKVQEALLALKLEGHYSKQQIVEIYLNRVYLGGGNFGIEAASQRYFGKSARALNTAEGAVLVGLLKAPSRYSPLNNPDLARKRGEQVLANMKDADLLDEAGLKKAKVLMKNVFAAHNNRWTRAPYFADWIADELTDYVGGLSQDVVVTTTLDTRLQKLADDAVSKVMSAEAGAVNASQAALVAMESDGAVKAMVGGVDYGQSQFNRATQALRQPGSSFKVFVYLAGMEAGWLPDSTLEDAPLTIPAARGRPAWSPKNSHEGYEGPVSLRTAFAKSLNTPAVRLSEQVGRDRVAQTARRLGVHFNSAVTPSIALGVTETTLFDMTTAYAHFAAAGRTVVPYGVQKIELAHPEKGQEKLLYQREGSGFGQTISPSNVAKMNSLMRAVVTSGTGTAAAIGRPAAGKTGTSQDFRDAWFMGFVPQLTAGVWVGNDNNAPMKKITGGKLPARIWAAFMTPAVAGLPAEDIPTYSGGVMDGVLPWQQGGQPIEPTNDNTPIEERASEISGGTLPQPERQPVPQQGVIQPAPEEAPARAEPQNGAPLGDSFWNTLMGPDGQPAKVQDGN